MTAVERIGFIGLGSQGRPIAERIVQAGYPLVVWARRPEALAPLTAQGASRAESIAELGARCDHVGLCVVDDAGVTEICNELIPAMKPGSRVAIHSTILPETCISLAKACSDRGINLIDAPVSGGGMGAAAGTLTVMCGASHQVFQASKPVFETFGKLIVLLGEVGAGQRAKIVNNALLAANMGLSHSALAAGHKLGLDPAALRELILESSGRSFGFEVYSRLPEPRAFSHGAPLLVKDLNLLKTILPDDEGAEALRIAADQFLSAATVATTPTETNP
jgi:3-hydroxyisobutyrate dehydrogenase